MGSAVDAPEPVLGKFREAFSFVGSCGAGGKRFRQHLTGPLCPFTRNQNFKLIAGKLRGAIDDRVYAGGSQYPLNAHCFHFGEGASASPNALTIELVRGGA
jgi:hypothetical protein